MARLKKLRHHIFVCVHKTCVKQGAKDSAKEFKAALKERDLRDRVIVTKSDCLDQCGRGPVVIVYPDGV
ncbi:MAG TPA: (2Fe-2S) ferredoxin domain-containing protein, partial [Pyrinomonadaceae bacterium]|nr:(2Fe-2S) ferredoxin domain-containing protein [Pyrinomonadaceae bacterium]